MNEIVTRFAPSPTGRLHVGNIRAALINWLFARNGGGRFLLRLDDTDAERSRAEYADAIVDDLAWLGLSPDGTVKQSERTALYDASFRKLRDAGRIYPAYETADELDLKRKVQAARGLPPVYDRAALKLSDAERARLEAEGVRPHWRFRLDMDGPVSWHDLVRGEAHIDPASLSDPVVRRADGSWLYMLPSVIDDIDMGVTHVVRGEDHVTNSGVQLQMFAALGAKAPEFAHVSLLTGAEGDKLSKRAGALGLDALREMGVEPVSIAALLARIGTSQPVEPVAGLSELAAEFSFAQFGRAPARFDPADLLPLNAKILHAADHARVADRLPPDMDEAAWHVIRPNVQTIGDVKALWQIVTGPVASTAAAEDAAYLAEAASALAELPWGDDIWPRWTAALKAATGRKGRALFLPLRQALTGEDHGPEMAGLVRLIGREEVLARLEAA
ncbi:glutamate--tRNA ligase [Pacificimonas sp. WHA3]|uniref:Glutamate--tRNA ligase n=1 Tax=Pacificimonas pallii TaxID=2827236 RepID=A0ABS6SCV0_9SPHN|nr:glutamate--tRNA ligase [Pacificimonas pallii]MBV7256180.1 glutamate--tRNA ligase [Pacificimonas pallii]